MILLAALVALAAGTAKQQAPAPPEVRVLTIDGVINPLSARYVKRELTDASTAGAAAVVLRLNTPGGLESSMREMVAAILGARVPVVAYVAPAGARAASAGMFLVLAADIAAMAPGTNIGAAHPVTIGAARQPDTALAEKAVSDAAALARAIAERRGRNADWAELAVRRSASITAHEALGMNVVDVIADGMPDLLRQVDGSRVNTRDGAIVVRTAGARVVTRGMSLPERIVHAITDPNIAYLLLTIGLIGIVAELYNPGTLFPGVTGVIALILAFVALGSLPVNWAAVALVVLGIGLFVADLITEGLGPLAVGALAAFVLGSLMFYSPFTTPSPALPQARVSPWVIAGVAASITVLLGVVGRALLRARREPVAIGAPALIGRSGIAEARLAPRGSVRIEGEVWTAISDEGGDGSATIETGEPIEVVDVEGVVLRVRKRSRESVSPYPARRTSRGDPGPYPTRHSSRGGPGLRGD